MSTENIAEPAEETLKALGQLAHAAEDRLKNVRRDRDGVDKQRMHVAQGANLAMQRLKDKDGVLIEEESRLAGALNLVHLASSDEVPDYDDHDHDQTPPASASPARPTVDSPTTAIPVVDLQPDRVYTRRELQNMSNEQLQVLVARRCNVHVVVTDANRLSIILIILDAQPQPRSNFDPRGYSGVQWVGVALGVIIAIILWTQWPEWPTRNMNEGGLQIFVNFVWFIAHVGAGFFIGGWIGWVIDQRRSHP
ncbi:hypothetical protein HY003_04160 [Candidatus Saccharibacteria bacterium]|nr:hypothetical protein [Candidatus Saccharibacteria bacterium]MBI3338463.1 hypothetical protein [Candidatus Saccharibacteria bacterium]